MEISVHAVLVARNAWRTTIGGVVLRAVIDHQHFQIAIIAGQNPLDRGDDHFFFVEGGDQHRDGRGRHSPIARLGLLAPKRFGSASPHSISSRATPRKMAPMKQ